MTYDLRKGKGQRDKKGSSNREDNEDGRMRGGRGVRGGGERGV